MLEEDAECAEAELVIQREHCVELDTRREQHPHAASAPFARCQGPGIDDQLLANARSCLRDRRAISSDAEAGRTDQLTRMRAEHGDAATATAEQVTVAAVAPATFSMVT